MTEDELLERFGLRPKQQDLEHVRSILREHAARERVRQGDGDTEVMKLCCVLLFSTGTTDDTLLIWAAKQASFDAACSIDVQLLCGAGLSETKDYLAAQATPEGLAALQYLVACESSGEFEGFTSGDRMKQYEDYYGVPSADTASAG